MLAWFIYFKIMCLGSLSNLNISFYVSKMWLFVLSEFKEFKITSSYVQTSSYIFTHFIHCTKDDTDIQHDNATAMSDSCKDVQLDSCKCISNMRYNGDINLFYWLFYWWSSSFQFMVPTVVIRQEPIHCRASSDSFSIMQEERHPK